MACSHIHSHLLLALQHLRSPLQHLISPKPKGIFEGRKRSFTEERQGGTADQLPSPPVLLLPIHSLTHSPTLYTYARPWVKRWDVGNGKQHGVEDRKEEPNELRMGKPGNGCGCGFICLRGSIPTLHILQYGISLSQYLAYLPRIYPPRNFLMFNVTQYQ